MSSFTGESAAAQTNIVDNVPAGSFTVASPVDVTKVQNFAYAVDGGHIFVTFDPVVDAVSYLAFIGYSEGVTIANASASLAIASGDDLGAQSLSVWVIAVAVFADASYGTPSDEIHDPGV